MFQNISSNGGLTHCGGNDLRLRVWAPQNISMSKTKRKKIEEWIPIDFIEIPINLLSETSYISLISYWNLQWIPCLGLQLLLDAGWMLIATETWRRFQTGWQMPKMKFKRWPKRCLDDGYGLLGKNRSWYVLIRYILSTYMVKYDVICILALYFWRLHCRHGQFISVRPTFCRAMFDSYYYWLSSFSMIEVLIYPLKVLQPIRGLWNLILGSLVI